MKTEVVKCDFENEFFKPERCFISETWNSSNDEMLSIARARVNPGVMTALHYLKGVKTVSYHIRERHSRSR